MQAPLRSSALAGRPDLRTDASALHVSRCEPTSSSLRPRLARAPAPRSVGSSREHRDVERPDAREMEPTAVPVPLTVAPLVTGKPHVRPLGSMRLSARARQRGRTQEGGVAAALPPPRRPNQGADHVRPSLIVSASALTAIIPLPGHRNLGHRPASSSLDPKLRGGPPDRRRGERSISLPATSTMSPRSSFSRFRPRTARGSARPRSLFGRRGSRPGCLVRRDLGILWRTGKVMARGEGLRF